jgi:type IV conjugative transfer system lipoprotein TraV
MTKKTGFKASPVAAHQVPPAVKSLALLFVPLMLTGCGSLTGFNNAQTNFSCQGKTGEPSCRTISEVFADTDYKMRLKDAFEEAKAQPFPAAGRGQAPMEPNTIRERVTGAGFAPKCQEGEAGCKDVSAGKPSAFQKLRRIPEKILRVWLAPFTDDKGDLHDARYVYVKVADAKWADGSEEALVKKDREARSSNNRIYQRVYPLKNPSDTETPDAESEKKKREADIRRNLTELQKNANPLLNRPASFPRN